MTMQQEEYREVRVLALPHDLEMQQMKLDELAMEKWRLVSVDNGIAYLDRPATAMLLERSRTSARAS